MITLVLGGSRSGKSAVAERLALRAAPDRSALGVTRHVDGSDGEVLYLATGWSDPDDADMAARIAGHRQRRSSRFRTIEVGADLPAALRAHAGEPVLVDALGTWVARHHDFEVPVDDLVAALRSRAAVTIVVSDEVGLGVHPETAVGRRFRDTLGTVNQRVAAVADTSYLIVAGRALELGAAP